MKMLLPFAIAAAFNSPGYVARQAVGPVSHIAYAAAGGLRDWQPATSDGNVLFVRDRTEQWYRVKLAGRCRFDRGIETLTYTTDPNGNFDRFSTVRTLRYPEQVCQVAQIEASAPPPGRPGHHR